MISQVGISVLIVGAINTKDILNNNIYILNGNSFIIKDNIKYFLDKSNGQYVIWDEFKEKFINNYKNINFNLNNFNNLKTLEYFEDFQFIPTFRTQESQDWSGARAAFEQNLVDLGVNWFVYIKFYIDKNNDIKPLVIGKSGSLNVNDTGSDISFSTYIDDGPARRFLQDKDLEWCKTHIAICKCDSGE